jgi:D-beta-D-heptose 7-phosphate kinase/D-beta-D-heptose 1-phosphate adenosyltransferase
MFENIKSKVLQENQLESIAAKYHAAGKTIVFCTGCYDILQSGHAVFFNQCKEFGDVLVVGVGSDYVISKLKGHTRPVNPENNRLYLVAALQDVDYAILNGNELKQPGKIDFENVLSKLRPDIFVLNDDDSAVKEKKEVCDKYDVKIAFVSRVVPSELYAASTTDIINKIK